MHPRLGTNGLSDRANAGDAREQEGDRGQHTERGDGHLPKRRGAVRAQVCPEGSQPEHIAVSEYIHICQIFNEI